MFTEVMNVGSTECASAMWNWDGGLGAGFFHLGAIRHE